MTLRSRPATSDDVQIFYPDVTCSFRAWVCEMDGEPQGIVGLALGRPYSIFCSFTEALRPFLKSLTVLRLLKALQRAVEACRAPVYAIRERSERSAPHILKRLGFVFHGLVDGEPVYVFRRAG